MNLHDHTSLQAAPREASQRFAPAVLLIALTAASLVGAVTQTVSAAPAGASGDFGASAVRDTNAPWGRLTAARFALTLPAEYFPMFPPAAGEIKWWFEGYESNGVAKLVFGWPLSEEQKQALLGGAIVAVASNKCAVSVSAEWVSRLGAEARQQIYPILARQPANTSYAFPFKFSAQNFADWFNGSNLKPEWVRLVKSLSYTNGGLVCFADLEALRRLLPAEQLRELLRTLYKTPSVSLTLHLDGESDVRELTRYWGSNGRESAVQPVLESMAGTPGGGTINVAMLLPPVPRVLLYTFDLQPRNPGQPRRDCYWSSLNFFSDSPDDRFLDGRYAHEFLIGHYETVAGPGRLGDLVMLVDGASNLVHVAVFVAQDVVFTKNGVGELQPWVLMPIPDMTGKYASMGAVRSVLMRKKS